jgi:HD-GYP domain-containing protein (c-di-GMP phosphodiesterase class II)
MHGIVSIQNFQLIGVYVLEPAEPVPPMTEDDIEFERFQTMGVFNIKDEMKALLEKEEPKNIGLLADLIISKYGKGEKKISFTQGLRSPSDYIYKHSLNVAILSALIIGYLDRKVVNMKDTIVAALVHDLGKLKLNNTLICKDDYDESELEHVQHAIIEGYDLLEFSGLSSNTRRIVSQFQRKAYKIGHYEQDEMNMSAKIIEVADTYDKLTAMKIDEEPSSEISVLRQLMNDKEYDKEIVNALTKGINIVVPGVCIELTTGEKGLVIQENPKDLLRPTVLTFPTNQVYVLADTDEIQIKDVMKTMDNRVIIDKERLNEYLN